MVFPFQFSFRRLTRWFTFGGLAFCLSAALAAQPNIIVIVADDLGWHDLTVQGATDLKTPNIDSLANSGVRFTRGYVTAPVCSPSRAGLMTGRYQQRFGHETNPGTTLERDSHFGLPLTEQTIADRLKLLGYTNGWVGKSHLGGDTNLYHHSSAASMNSLVSSRATTITSTPPAAMRRTKIQFSEATRRWMKPTISPTRFRASA